MISTLKIFTAAIFFVFICWIIYAADSGQTNDFILLSKTIPFGDKIGHFTLYGILVFLVNMATQMKTIKLGSIKVWMGTFFVSIFAVGEEFTQILFISRNFDTVDILFDFMGISLFSWLSVKLLQGNSQISR